jgi:hypothetical protein
VGRRPRRLSADNGTLPSVRDPQTLDHLAATYPLGIAPELLLFGHPDEHDYSDPSVTEPIREHWQRIRVTTEPEPPPIGAVLDDPAFQERYPVSRDSEGRLHSLDDQPALYIYAPFTDFLHVFYYVHGELGRVGDLPDDVMMYPERNQLHQLKWHVSARPGGAPTAIYKNGASGQCLSWMPGRLDGPVAVDRYSMEWGLTTELPIPEWADPPVTVLFSIAYSSAQPLTDTDARLLVHHLDELDPSPSERQVLIRTLLRWQPAISEDTRNWLVGLV